MNGPLTDEERFNWPVDDLGLNSPEETLDDTDGAGLVET
jgi:hypothetical protein